MDLLFSFAGRIGRGKFWLGWVLLIALSLVLVLLLGVAGNAVGLSEQSKGPLTGGQIAFFIGTAIVYLIILWMELAIVIKRCHDRGKSAWWALLLLVPLVNLIWMIVDLGILEGVPETNKWGPPAVMKA